MGSNVPERAGRSLAVEPGGRAVTLPTPGFARTGPGWCRGGSPPPLYSEAQDLHPLAESRLHPGPVFSPPPTAVPSRNGGATAAARIRTDGDLFPGSIGTVVQALARTPSGRRLERSRRRNARQPCRGPTCQSRNSRGPGRRTPVGGDGPRSPASAGRTPRAPLPGARRETLPPARPGRRFRQPGRGGGTGGRRTPRRSRTADSSPTRRFEARRPVPGRGSRRTPGAARRTLPGTCRGPADQNT